MTVLREVSWGDALVVAAFKSPGGLNVAVNVIRGQVGSHIGVRNTFAKLLHVGDLGVLDDRDRFRAWLLITALGANPAEWGLSVDDVPNAYDVDQLEASLVRREGIEPPTR